MDALMGDIKTIVILVVLFIYGIGLLFVFLAAVVYFIGYVYDCFIYGLAVRIGHWVGRKFPKIKHTSWARSMWNAIQPKETYLRYETPLFTYCFSYTAIMFISIAFPFDEEVNIVVASMIYLLCYFWGMKRRYRANEENYEEVLRNNSAFLKLSFLPLTFLITVLGFYCTVTGKNIADIQEDITQIQNMFMKWLDNVSTNTLSIGNMIAMSVVIILLLYVVSLPIQVMAYFIISVIAYFGKHNTAYIRMIKIFIKLIINILKKMLSPLIGVFRELFLIGKGFFRCYDRVTMEAKVSESGQKGETMKAVKEFYRENKVLCRCSLVAMGIVLSYYITYDMPELIRGINKWYELFVTLGIGIITNLLFFIFQVYLPKKKKEKVAYELVLGRLQVICRNLWEKVLIAEYFFEDVQKGILVIKDPVVYYKLIEEKDGNCGWGGAFDFRKNLVTSIENIEVSMEKILDDRVFLNCSDELITVVANIQRNHFFVSLKRAQKDDFPRGVTYGDCEREYELLIKDLERLQELVDPMKCYSIRELTEEEIRVLRSRLAQEIPEGYEVEQFAKIYI